MAYPKTQLRNGIHDNIHQSFDSYYDNINSNWKSSDSGSNFKLSKESDTFFLKYDSGIAQGGVISWNDGITLSKDGIVSFPKTSRVQARRDTTQSIPNNSWTVMVYDIEDVDEQSEYNPTTGVFTAKKAGSYATAWGTYTQSAAWTAGEAWTSAISKNNSEADGNCYHGIRFIARTNFNGSMISNGSAIIKLAINDTLRIKCWHNQGAAVNTVDFSQGSFFHVHKIS